MEAIQRDSRHFLTESAELAEKRLSQKAAQAAFFLLGSVFCGRKSTCAALFGE